MLTINFFSLCLTSHKYIDDDMIYKLFEPRHEKMCLMSYAKNKNAFSHPRSLISAFVVRCLDSIISLDSIAEISRL